MDSSKKVSSDDQYVLLRDALRKKDIETVHKLLLNNAPVNAIKKLSSNTPLHWAIKNFEDTKFVEILLKKGADIYIQNQERKTSFQIAASYNRVDVIILLLTKSKNISDDLESAINEATERKINKVIESLIKYIVNARIAVNLSKSIDIAAKYGSIDILKYLLHYNKTDSQTIKHISIDVFNNGPKSQEIFCHLYKCGFRISPKDKKSIEYIYAVVKAKCPKIVKYILDSGVDINEINKSTGYALLHVACLNKDREIIQLLINYKANLNIKVLEGNVIEKSSKSNSENHFFNKTPLFIAVYYSDINIVKILLENGASTKEEPDILITAIQKSSKEIIHILLQYGADTNAADASGKHPLYYIIKTSNGNSVYEYFTYDSFPTFTIKDDNARTDMVDLFLRNGANPNINHTNVSPLQAAIAEGDLTVVKLLLKYKADINYSNSKGNTPTHFAVNGDATILDIILKCHPNINVANKQLMTPLHVAVVKKNIDAVKKLLVKSCQNIDYGDEDGNTALHLVFKHCKNVNIVKILLKHKANVNAKDRHGKTPLHTFAKHCFRQLKLYANILQTFIKHGAEINVADNNGLTPLVLACKERHEHIAKLFLNHGADVNWTIPDGTTALHEAVSMSVMGQNVQIFELLLRQGADINITCNNNETAVDYIKKAINKIDITVVTREPTHSSDDKISRNRIELYKIAREHVIKLRCAKLASEKNFHLVYMDTKLIETVNLIITQSQQKKLVDISLIEDRCNKEIEYLNCITTGTCTLYNLLNMGVHDLSRFVKNEEIIRTLKSDSFSMQFPIYSEIMKNRFAQAMSRSELLKIAEQCAICSIFRKLPLFCINYIFGFLDYKSLVVFVNTIK